MCCASVCTLTHVGARVRKTERVPGWHWVQPKGSYSIDIGH